MIATAGRLSRIVSPLPWHAEQIILVLTNW